MIPKEVLDLFPTFEYRCPTCGTYSEANVSFCPRCKMVFDDLKWRVPPRFLKSHEAMSEYAHKVLAPKLNPQQRELLLKYFSVLFQDGFESGDFSAWTGTKVLPGCSLTVVTEQAHHGSYSAKAVSTSGTLDYPACCYKTFTAQTTLAKRVYARWASFPSSGTRDQVLEIYNSVTMGVKNDAGTMKWDFWYVTGVSTWNEIVVASPTPQLNTWYCLELKAVKGTSGEVRYYINGNEVASATNIDTSLYNTYEVDAGLTYSESAHTVYVDCVVVADTYIGPEAAIVAMNPALKYTPHSAI